MVSKVAGIDVSNALAVLTFITTATGLTAYADTNGHPGAVTLDGDAFDEDAPLG